MKLNRSFMAGECITSLRLRFMFDLKRQSRSIENDYDLELS